MKDSARSPTPRVVRLLLVSALLGFTVEAAMFISQGPSEEAVGWIVWLLMMAPLSIVPLTLALVDTPRRDGSRSGFYRAAAWLQLVGAACVLASFYGTEHLVLGWLAVTLVIAAFGLWRVVQRGWCWPEEWAIDMGLIYLPVGAVWLTAYQLNYPLLGFDPAIVLLTAVHFHYAGLAAPVIAGLVGRVVRQGQNGRMPRTFTAALVLVIAGPPLVAAGILWSSVYEAVGAVLLALGLITLAIWSVVAAVRWVSGWAARVLLTLPALAVATAMVFAVLYALRGWVVLDWLDIPTMVLIHGAANALGFALCALVGLAFVRPVSSASSPGMPCSRLRSIGRVGPAFFHRVGAVDAIGVPAHGLVDDLAEYKRPGFDPDAVHPAVRSFYEHTDRAWLTVVPDWRPGFRLGGRIFHLFARAMGQLVLPVTPQRPEHIDSAIFRLKDKQDGRDNVRAWIRTYRDTDRPVYIAAYATHRHAEMPYMNIAFPTPGGSLTSVLRIDALTDPGQTGGIILSTRRVDDGGGDQGVYWVMAGVPIRTPLSETIRVWYDSDTNEVRAVHDLWLLGLQYLRLNYTVGVDGEPGSAPVQLDSETN